MERSISRDSQGIGNHTQINYVAAMKAGIIIRAINHRIRQHIIKLLEENKRMIVTAIYVKLSLKQSIASQHLAILRRAKIVTVEREGRVIYYSLNYGHIEEVDTYIMKFVHE